MNDHDSLRSTIITKNIEGSIELSIADIQAECVKDTGRAAG